MLKITLTKGLVGKTEVQRKVVSALGLGKFGSTAVHADSPVIRGMIKKVSHLISVEPTTEAKGGPKDTEKKTALKKAATKASAK